MATTVSTRQGQEPDLRRDGRIGQSLTALPQVPTAVEAGLRGFTLDSWFALHGPAGLPAEVVQTLHAEIGKIPAMPETRRRSEESGTTVEQMSPAQLAGFIRRELDYWGKVIKSSNITAE